MNTKLLILIVCILLTTLASLIVGSLAKIPDEHFKHRRRRKHHKHHKHHINTSINTPQNISTASVSTPKIIQSTNSTSLPSNVSIRSTVVSSKYSPISLNNDSYMKIDKTIMNQLVTPSARYSPISQNTSTIVYAPVTQLIPIPQIMEPQIIKPTNVTSLPSSSIPSNLVSSGYSPVPQSDPYIKIYKDAYDDDQVASQPIKYISDTLKNCKLACDNNKNCVGISRYTTEYNPDVEGDCTLLTYPYNLLEPGSNSGWITYAKQ
jgi:hypothetical protein